jgi:hypothetical protein
VIPLGLRLDGTSIMPITELISAVPNTFIFLDW